MCAACLLSAEYFGRNKVRYDDFDFRVLKTEHFDVLHYPAESTSVVLAARMLERWDDRYRSIFGKALDKNQPVIIYANDADFGQTNVIGGFIPQSVGGVTEGGMNRIAVPLSGIAAQNDHVLGHELVHAYQFRTTAKRGGRVRQLDLLPLWLVEGMAEYLSVGSRAPLTAMWMRDAVLRKKVPSFEEITRDPRYFAYRYGHAIWAYMAGGWGDGKADVLLRAATESGWEKGLQKVAHVPVDSLSNAWQKLISRTYQPALEGRTDPARLGRRVAEGKSLNIFPSISPDGRHVVFLSSRDLFQMELYLADARTGQTIRKLTDFTPEAHFENVRYVDFSGAWSPDGRRFAFPVFNKGGNEVSIVDVASRKIVSTMKIGSLGAIYHLAWSPDGHRLLLSATTGGVSDLWLYDIARGTTEMLTDDLFAQIQPAWAPGGEAFAFVTDSGQDVNLDSLRSSPLRIVIRRFGSDTTLTIASTPWAKNINPQFSPDGKSVYFVSDPDGFSDIYRYSLETDSCYRVTRVATGITGLSESSPAMSVAAINGSAVFTVYSNMEYVVAVLDSAAMVGEPFETPGYEAYLASVTLPSERRVGPLVDRYLDSAFHPTDNGETFLVENYRPKLNLIRAGQLSAGITGSDAGVGFGGGVDLLFSDVLGDHLWGIGTYVSSELRNTSGSVMYQSRGHRLNRGLLVSHTPVLATYAGMGYELDENYSVPVFSILEHRAVYDHVRITTEYPLSRTRRFELATAYTNIRYDFSYLRSYDMVNWLRTDAPSPSPLGLGQVSFAFVGDNTFSAFASPVRGSRFRFGLDPTFGSLLFVGALADLRNYLYNPYATVAARLMHQGRYLFDAESERLAPYFIGHGSLVRGYEVHTYSPLEYSSPRFARLFGSRTAVGNIELRLPLLGSDQYGYLDFPYVPTELIGFVDAGVAWNNGTLPEPRVSRTTDKRIPVVSAGGALRFNLLSMTVLQVYCAYPFHHADQDWKVGWLLSPGW